MPQTMVNNTTLSLPGDGGPEGVANGTFQANDRSGSDPGITATQY